MSIHTILSQMEEEFDKKFSSIEVYYNERSQFYGVIIPEDIHENDEYTLNDIKKFMRSFATRIVEEVGKETTQQVKLFIKDQSEHEVSKEHTLELMPSLLEHIFDNLLDTKLQKMKGDL